MDLCDGRTGNFLFHLEAKETLFHALRNRSRSPFLFVPKRAELSSEIRKKPAEEQGEQGAERGAEQGERGARQEGPGVG